MQLFKPFVGVTFRHNYYQSNSYTFLRVIPSEETSQLFLKHGFLLKAERSGFRIFYDAWFAGTSRSKEELQKLLLTFRFFLDNTSKDIQSYTEGLESYIPDRTILYFKNTQDLPPDGRLHAEPFAGGANIIPAGIFTIPGTYNRPLGIVDIDLKDMQVTDYYLQFNAKSVFWRYSLVSQHLRDLENPAVINKADKSAFDGPVRLTLPDAKTAVVFVSKDPIKLSEQLNRNLQLVENYVPETGKYKVVLQMLPNPDMKKISVIDEMADKSDLMKYAEVII